MNNYTEIQAILDSVDAPTVIFCHNQLRLANRAAIVWTGIGDDDLSKQQLWDWIHPKARRNALSIYRKLKQGKVPKTPFKICFQHPMAGYVWVTISIKEATYLDDNCWVATFLDSGVNSMVSVSDSSPKNISQELQADETIAINPTLSNIIAEERLMSNMLDQFLETLDEIIPYDSASIALVREQKLEFIAVQGMLEGIELSKLTHELRDRQLKPADIVIEAKHGLVQVIHDVRKELSWIAIEGTEYIRSWMEILLYFDGEVVGLLNLDHSQPSFFTRVHAQQALALARQATLAIIYTRLYQQTQLDIQERERLQQILVCNLITTETVYTTQQMLASNQALSETLPILLNIMASPMENTSIFLLVFDIEEAKLLHRLQYSNSDDDIWSIFRAIIKQPNLPQNVMPTNDLVDMENVVHTLADSRQAIVGVINRRSMIFSVRSANTEPFSEIEQELMITIANQITIAAENERLDAQVQQYTQQLERLVEQRTQELSVEQKRLQAILDATAEGIFYMENFLIQYVNPAFCRMVGYSFNELEGKPLSFVRVASENTETHNFNTMLDNPMEIEAGRSETRLRHCDGTEFYASVSYALIGQPNENPIRMVAIARDISQERKLYFQRARFIANAAHELRTPLSSLVLRLHMLRRQPEKISTHLDNLDKVAVYLRQLVEQLLDVSRFERGAIILDRSKHVIQSLIQQAVTEHTPFAKSEGVSVELELANEAIEINGDGTRLLQMISNLVANGVNYNGQGGFVRVMMRVEEDVVGNHNAIIEVSDNGVGVDSELLPDEIFEPFSRPSAGSRQETGMGLALVREIAVLHGGTIHVHSKLNEGSTFRISLPLD